MHQPERRRILVVDDEACIADTLVIILRRAGYEATATCEPGSALDACTESTPDLLLTDVMMPGINGIELAVLVQQRCPECRVMLLTGLGVSFNLAEHARRQGHDFAILAKPIRPVDLLERVAAALSGRSLESAGQHVRPTQDDNRWRAEPMHGNHG